MAKDLRPFSVVDNSGFRRLVNTLEPKYAIPSRPYFSRTVLPALQRKEYGCSGERGRTFPTHKVFCPHFKPRFKSGFERKPGKPSAW
ncbi:hypothetical protein F7725_018726 [Dissostichus mawsoni]|nr:hypothetical protein F7725_018726 [Dissostichus mawsoni]